MTAAFMAVALVAAKKYETFFGSQLYANFRDTASKRMITVLAEPYVKDLGQDLARRRSYSIVDQELSLVPAQWIKVACTTSGHNLTPGDWRRYISATPPAQLGCAR